MNIRNMEYIVRSADTLNFGKAARLCHISQPTISGQIKQVEDYLGVTIFERSRKGVIVTPNGRAIVEAARQVLESYNQFVSLRQGKDDIYSGPRLLKLGIFPTLAPYLLPQMLPTLRIHHPLLQYHLVEERTQPLLNQLINGTIDIALVAMPIAPPQLEVHHIFDEDFVLAIHYQHPLAKLEQISLRHLKKQNVLLLNEGHCFRDQALDICKAAGANTLDEFKGTSLETLKHMVSAKIGITLVPEMASDNNHTLRYIKFKKPAKRQIGMAWRKKSIDKDFYILLCSHIRHCIHNKDMEELKNKTVTKSINNSAIHNTINDAIDTK